MILPRRRALVIMLDAARRRETHEALAGSSMAALADIATTTLVAPSCWTIPCVASTLTGLFPAEHGMSWPLERGRLEAPTVADLLADAGRSFRLLSGNHLYAPPVMRLPEDCIEFPRRHSWRPGTFLGRTLSLIDYGGRAILRGVERMAAERELPDLLVLHLQEAHHPYLAPPRGPAPGARARYAAGHLAYYLTRGAQVWQFAAGADERAWRRQRARYLECIDYAVGIVEGVLGAYDRAGALESALVVITADHGEHLGEHGLADHQASLHDDLVNCPCALLAPELTPGAELPGQFQHTDLLMTLCNYLDVPTAGYDPAWAPRDILAAQGRSRGHEHAFMQWSAWGPEQIAALQSRNPAYDFSALRRDLRAVRSRRWKYISGSDGSEALYDLRADPAERRDLCVERPEVLRELDAKLRDWLRCVTEGRSVCEEDRQGGGRIAEERLRGLGYV